MGKSLFLILPAVPMADETKNKSKVSMSINAIVSVMRQTETFLTILKKTPELICTVVPYLITEKLNNEALRRQSTL